MENTIIINNDPPPPPYAEVDPNLTHPVHPIPYQQSYGARVNYARPNPNQALELAKIQDYMGWSIFNLLCCCFPFGIIAMIFSSQIRERKLVGDVAGARNLSSKAVIWNIFATLAGIGIIVGVVVYYTSHRSSY